MPARSRRRDGVRPRKAAALIAAAARGSSAGKTTPKVIPAKTAATAMETAIAQGAARSLGSGHGMTGNSHPATVRVAAPTRRAAAVPAA